MKTEAFNMKAYCTHVNLSPHQIEDDEITIELSDGTKYQFSETVNGKLEVMKVGNNRQFFIHPVTGNVIRI